jgi:predicted DNA-binding transcriptional regulator AlpA
MADTNRLLTLKEIEAESGIDRVTLYRLIAAGDLACVRLQLGPGAKRKTRGHIRIKRSDWDDWVERHRTPATRAQTAPAKRPRADAVLELPGAGRYVS